jgi:all-trans-retinol 13,14-reductase
MVYDFVIIGSGLGGLVCGAILSKEGYNVCILEKNHQPGGNLQSFRRDGHLFDTGLHYIGSMDPGQTLNNFFHYLGIDSRIRLKRMSEDGFDRISFNYENHMYHHSQRWENFVESLGRQFPSEREGIASYALAIQEVIRSIPMYDLEHAESPLLEPALLQGSAMSLIRSVTQDRRLVSVLAGANALYHGAAINTPLYVHACIRNSFVSSAWRPVGGSGHIAEALVEIIRENGGTIHCEAEVSSFEFHADSVSAAMTSDGRRFPARHFISAAHPLTTLQWIPPDKLRKSYRKRIENLRNSPGFFSVYLILREESFPYLNHNHFHYGSDHYFDDEIHGHWPQMYLFYTPADEPEQDYARTASILSFMNYDEICLFDTDPALRGPRYTRFKEEKAEALIAMASRQYPGLEKAVKKIHISTPLTFKDYTGTWHGSAYGIMKGAADPARGILQPRTRIPNLCLTGQNLNLHGILGTTVSAFITASVFTGFRELIQKVRHAS